MADLHLAEGIELLERRAKIVKALLIAGFLTILATLIGEIAELNGIVSLDHDDMGSLDILYGAALLGESLVLLVTYILFGMWIYRAAANVDAAAVPGFIHTPAWAVGWYFIPVANLFKPFGAMRQIWNASHGHSGALDRGNILLTAWWAIWVVSGFVGYAAVRTGWGAATPEALANALQLEIFASTVDLALYPLAYLLVERITFAQKTRMTAAHIFT